MGKSRLFIPVLLFWSCFLVYDIKESAHISVIVVDMIVCLAIVFLYFKYPKNTIKIKTLQQVEDEIREIEAKQNNCT